LAVASAGLLVFSFPDFNLWPLAWVGLVPLILAVARKPRGPQAFLLGWTTGTLFFYGSCYWLTHAMVHYGGIPRWLAYLLLVPAPLLTGLFPALWALLLAHTSARCGLGRALLLAPPAWAAFEWARLGLTGQLWNALGYSQAYTPALIQPARWGGVYAVGFLIAAVNAALAYAVWRRSVRACAALASVAALVALTIFLSNRADDSAQQPATHPARQATQPGALVVGVQPNVPVEFGRSSEQTAALVRRHLTMSTDAFRAWDAAHAPTDVKIPRVVIWPESPMNFAYARDDAFRQTLARFARENRTYVLFNSLEPAPAGGFYNSAVMVDAEGRLVAQYDKIRLLPFGEYVPLPRWLPLAWMLSGVVGDFTPGEKYPLMPLGENGGAGLRAGVFICFESAFPAIARRFADEGADVLVNISNDGYLGRTAVMRQHLANVVFRAVETNRPVLRVTNTGISARITPRGEVLDATEGFTPAALTWTVERAGAGKTFYTKHGDMFPAICVALTALGLAATFKVRLKTGPR
jgi:apolipoprotein N-acyltransferase